MYFKSRIVLLLNSFLKRKQKSFYITNNLQYNKKYKNKNSTHFSHPIFQISKSNIIHKYEFQICFSAHRKLMRLCTTQFLANLRENKHPPTYYTKKNKNKCRKYCHYPLQA